MRKLRSIVPALLLLMTAIGLSPQAAAQGLAALDGRTVRIIVGANPGGSTDRYARLLIDALEPMLPNTALLAQNLPGGDGLLAVAEGAMAGPNAITLVVIQTGPLYEQLRRTDSPSIDIGEFHPIGSLATNQRVVAVRSSLGAASFAELVALDRHLVDATYSATASNHMDSLLVAAMTAMHTHVVTGVDDEVRDPMMMAGEVDLSVSTYLNLRPLFLSGAAIPLLRTGASGYQADLAELPTLADVALPETPPELIAMMDTLNLIGRLVMAVPNTDPGVVAALRIAFDEAVASPEVQRAYAAQSLDLSPTPGAEIERRISVLLHDAPAGEAFRAYLACGEDESERGVSVDCSAR